MIPRGFFPLKDYQKGHGKHLKEVSLGYFSHIGWELNELVGGSGDHGADIIAAYRNEEGDLLEYIYQAKFSERNKPISVDIIGDLKRGNGVLWHY